MTSKSNPLMAGSYETSPVGGGMVHSGPQEASIPAAADGRVAGLREEIATIISPSLFRMIPRGTKRPRGAGETTGKYRHADREEFRERARAKADQILALINGSQQ